MAGACGSCGGLAGVAVLDPRSRPTGKVYACAVCSPGIKGVAVDLTPRDAEGNPVLSDSPVGEQEDDEEMPEPEPEVVKAKAAPKS